jgi:N-methylhydantoinase B/oxoprolinase/acetone carboxylase alpha subunit
MCFHVEVLLELEVVNYPNLDILDSKAHIAGAAKLVEEVQEIAISVAFHDVPCLAKNLVLIFHC